MGLLNFEFPIRDLACEIICIWASAFAKVSRWSLTKSAQEVLRGEHAEERPEKPCSSRAGGLRERKGLAKRRVLWIALGDMNRSSCFVGVLM